MKSNNFKENIIIHLENLEKINNNSIDDFTVEDIEVSIQNYGTYTTTNFVKDISVFYNKDIISLLRKRIKIKLIKNGENK